MVCPSRDGSQAGLAGAAWYRAAGKRFGQPTVAVVTTHWRHATRPAALRWWRQLWEVRLLSPTRAERAWVIVLAVCLAIKHRVPRARDICLPMRIRGGGTVWLSDWSQLMVAWEIYVVDTYAEHPLPDDPRTIVDGGANAGLASRYLRARYPTARIVAIEPDPATARVAERNLRGLNVSVMHAALAPVDGTITLYRQPGESWASTTASGAGVPVSVKAIALDSLIDEVGPISILKLDIEGAEHEVMASSRRLGAIGCIIGEVHPAPGTTAETFFAGLSGFDVVTGPMVNGNGTFLARRAYPAPSTRSA